VYFEETVEVVVLLVVDPFGPEERPYVKLPELSIFYRDGGGLRVIPSKWKQDSDHVVDGKQDEVEEEGDCIRSDAEKSLGGGLGQDAWKLGEIPLQGRRLPEEVILEEGLQIQAI
jgi:hypothetical protein